LDKVINIFEACVPAVDEQIDYLNVLNEGFGSNKFSLIEIKRLVNNKAKEAKTPKL
jgi:hypothetical protein